MLDSFFNSIDFKTAMLFLTTIGAIIAALIFFIYQRRQIALFEYSRIRENVIEGPKLRDSILDLLKQNDDVDLRLLTELYEGEGRKFYGFPRQPRMIYVLRDLQSDLRKMLKEIIKSKEHYALKNKILSLIDEAENKAKSLLEKKPFDDLGDPEKSLLIDILEELPKDKAMPKQKLLQMAEIIKNKYQNIEKLQEENRKSAAWTRWGAFGTLFFGILSLILSIYSVTR